MTSRGAVVQVLREYHQWDSRTRSWLTIEENRPALCLLPDAMADALRAQVTVQGTTHQGEVKADAAGNVDPADLGPFEFGEAWAGHDARPTAWKALQVDVAASGRGLAKRGAMTSEWSQSATKHLRGLLADTSHAAGELRKVVRAHRHPDVFRLVGGDVIAIQGQDLLVISNETLHQGFRYPVVIACPLIHGSKIDPRTPGAVFLRAARVGWELSQRVELGAVRFTVQPSNSGEPAGGRASVVEQVRSSVLRFWTGATPTNVPHPAFTDLLRRCADERDRLGLSHQLAPLRRVEVLDYALHRKRTARGGGHFYDGVDRGVLPGEELFEVETSSALLVLSINRKGSDVGVVVESNELDADEILYAWVVDEKGDQVSSVGQNEISDNHGVAELSLGRARPGEVLVRTVGVATTHGSEEFRLDLAWTLET